MTFLIYFISGLFFISTTKVHVLTGKVEKISFVHTHDFDSWSLELIQLKNKHFLPDMSRAIQINRIGQLYISLH